MVINYQKEMDKILQNLDNENGTLPKLLLHSCCAPCSSYVIEYLSKLFEISVFFYNPNITDEVEYDTRLNEQKRFIEEFVTPNKVNLITGEYDIDTFYSFARGMAKEPEGGLRCFSCYELRLKKSAKIAKDKGYDFFATTLTVSPYKNAKKINHLGHKIQEDIGVRYLVSDFKKKNGYKRSIELSKEYNLYRQNYCGCVYSKV